MEEPPLEEQQQQQISQLKQIFNRFDTDNDGSLTLLELAALLRSLGLTPTADHLLSFDLNRNGYVEFHELYHTILPQLTAHLSDDHGNLSAVFGEFDRDGNGVITAAELAGAMAKMGQPLTYKELMEMINSADENGDGVISFHEFGSIMAKSAADFLGFN